MRWLVRWPWRSQSLLASLSGTCLCSVELRRSRVSSLGSPCVACSVEGAACLCHAMACAVAMEITQSACLTFWEVSLLRRTSTEQGRRPKKPMSSLFCLCHVMACAVAMDIAQSACLTFWEVSLLRRTLTEQGRLPKKPMSGLFCGEICLSPSCDDLCCGHGDHKICSPLFLGSCFAPSNFGGAGSSP